MRERIGISDNLDVRVEYRDTVPCSRILLFLDKKKQKSRLVFFFNASKKSKILNKMKLATLKHHFVFHGFYTSFPLKEKMSK
jgi:hypothetical protein